MSDREYWHARIQESMFALRAEEYKGRINLRDHSAVAKFLIDEICYSCLREFLDSLPENDPRRIEYLVFLPENKRENPASSEFLARILQ